MNIIKQCTFFDRYRNSLIELDDLVEEFYQNKAKTSTNKFYIIFYFSANWLPDSLNKTLNEKLLKLNLRKDELNFEIIFVSSDKTIDSYTNFLKSNKFIRYSLEFHEQDLKKQLYKYFNINGIPYLTLISFELNSNLKIVDFYTEKNNIKHKILADESGDNFPWLNQNEIFLQDCEAEQEKENLLDQILKNLLFLPDEFKSSKNLDNLKNDYNFVFILFDCAEPSEKLLDSLSRFWTEHNSKYKILNIYINQSTKLEFDFSKSEWYTIKSKKLKERYLLELKIKSLPILAIFNIKTGELLNHEITLRLMEKMHSFCSNECEKVSQKEIKTYEENNFNLNFDFDQYDICQDSKHKIKKIKRKKIDSTLLKQLEENLVEISATKSDYEPNQNNFYLLYFCSYFTSTNSASLFENVIDFLNYLNEKLECSIKIILISSDQSEEDYKKLLHDYKSNFVNKKSKKVGFKTDKDEKEEFFYPKFALNFKSKKINENLIKELHISGIPWFSLINQSNSEILCENLKIFILNSKLREIVF